MVLASSRMSWFICWVMSCRRSVSATTLLLVTVRLSSPWASVPLILAVISAFYHLRLGLQVVIEDYQHDFTRVIATTSAKVQAASVASARRMKA